MTISSTVTKTYYAGNGSTTAFAVPFMFVDSEDVEVILKTVEGAETFLELGSDFSLSGEGQAAGGVCTLDSPPLPGESLVIRRNPRMVQEVDYVENDPFPAETHEAALDTLTMICQALSERLDRTITFRVSSAVTGVHVPDPEPGKMLAWNDAGDNLQNRIPADLSAVLLPLSVVNGGTGADSGGQALANMGVSTFGQGLVGATNAEEAAEALGLGDAARTGEPNTWSKAQSSGGTELAIAAGAVSWDLEANQYATLELTENVTGLTPSNLTANTPYVLLVKQDATGGRTLDLSAFLWPDGESPEIPTDPSAVTILSFLSDGTDLYGWGTGLAWS